jgi:hypothetical protein
MNLEQIILEELDKVLKNDKKTLVENKPSQKTKKRTSGKNVDVSTEKNIEGKADTDLINTAALAKRIYPDHTPQGAQSQLRKKLKSIKNDNGSEYHIKQGEADKLRSILKNI